MPKIPFWIFIVIAIVYFTAIRVDTMDIDASQYASMSRQLLHSHNWLHLYDGYEGTTLREYLDKPPFLFWITACSLKVFGVNNLGYKLPSILFALWALLATVKLAKLWYGEHIGRVAALILASSQGMFLMTNDIRCDTILMSWVITAVWQIAEWDKNRKLKHLLLGFAAAGMGMMTKGPIALMVPAFSFGAHWVLSRDWKKFLQPGYLVGLIVIAILLVPMSIGLYTQFDQHPEKMVNGMKGVSGLRFFYWSQSFGRITGESPWKNGADMSFLMLNMLWSFLPWIFIFIPAFIINVVKLLKAKLKLREGQEWITMGGFLLTYLSLGASAYQLPHYIFVVFPFAAIITAVFLGDFAESGKGSFVFKILGAVYMFIPPMLLAAALLTITYVFPADWPAILLWVVLAAVMVYLGLIRKVADKMLWLPVYAIVVANIFMTNGFYAKLLQYQVGSTMGKYIYEHKMDVNDIAAYKMRDPLNSLAFYAQGFIAINDTLEYLGGKHYLLTMKEGLADLKTKGLSYDILKEGDQYKVSELTPQFLNPKTRDSATARYYFLKLK